MNFKNAIIAVGILLAVGIGIYIIPKTKSLNDASSGSVTTFVQNPSQYNVLGQGNPTPSTSSTSSSSSTSVMVPPVATLPSTTPAPTPKTTTAPRATAPSTSVVLASAPTTQLYKIEPLNFQITVPISWMPSAQTQTSDKIFFYDSTDRNLEGTANILLNANQSFSSLALQLAADQTNSNFQKITVGGEPALSYASSIDGPYNIATVFNNSTYYFSGGLTRSSIVNTIRFTQ